VLVQWCDRLFDQKIYSLTCFSRPWQTKTNLRSYLKNVLATAEFENTFLFQQEREGKFRDVPLGLIVRTGRTLNGYHESYFRQT